MQASAEFSQHIHFSSTPVRNGALLLALYALCTNAGLKRLAAGVADVSIDELAHVHRRYIDAGALRAACAKVANATLAIRNPQIWGAFGTTCASDSTKFGVPCCKRFDASVSKAPHWPRLNATRYA